MGSEGKNYSPLKDLRLKIGEETEGGFCICFWVYLKTPTSFPVSIIRQVLSYNAESIPLIIIDEKKNVIFFPLHFPHIEDPNSGDPASWVGAPCVSADVKFTFDKWVHVGCEVSNDCVRLHIDGELVGEKHISLSPNNDFDKNGTKGVIFNSIYGDAALHGYVHNVEILPAMSCVKDHHIKDPPVQLSIDSSSASEIEEESDGVWNIVGGKASCRRIFSLDVILLDAFGQPATKEMEVFASLLYNDGGEPVEKLDDAEAPLLTIHDGIEYASWDRPSKLLRGRASFRLNISQLSSKCDNKLFRIRFGIPKVGRFPFLEALSYPIRCISRTHNDRPISVKWKKSSNVQYENGSQSSELDDICSKLNYNGVSESKGSPPLKRVKPAEAKSFCTCKDSLRDDEECNSHAWTTKKVDNGLGTNLERKQEIPDAAGDSGSDSESTEERSSSAKSMSGRRNPISDLTIFKYCLGSLTDRSLLLSEIATSTSHEGLVDFAQQVSLFSGCYHHRLPIMTAKRLMVEGTKVWNLISQSNHRVHWEDVVFQIEKHFMKIACCSTRSLAQQDFDLLKNISGCRDYLARENFDKMWRWLYPVAFTISQECINSLWCSRSPKWIEGFITKEEAESSLLDPRGIQEPGSFVLRFPTSRSWPHPDAGSLIVTYVGRDYTLHHRLLSLDFIYSSGNRNSTSRPLQDMLLAEPELSRPGRVRRSR